MEVGIVRKNSVQDAVYQVLRDAIMSLRLEPGTVMSTQEMANKLNVSRTPVREAFIRLQKENLVDIIPQKETIVSRIDLKRVLQERFIRESLELAVIDPFLEKCGPENLAVMKRLVEKQKEAMKAGESVELINQDNLMHRELFVAAGQELAWDTLQSVNGHDYRFRILSVRVENIMGEAIRQHERMISCIENRDLEGARKELAHHLRKLRYEKDKLTEVFPDYFRKEEDGLIIQGF